MKNLTSTARDFDIQIEFEGKQIPFYAYNYEKDFINGSSMDKAVLFLNYFTNLSEQTKSKITEDTSKSSMAQAHQDQGNVLSLLK